MKSKGWWESVHYVYVWLQVTKEQINKAFCSKVSNNFMGGKQLEMLTHKIREKLKKKRK